MIAGILVVMAMLLTPTAAAEVTAFSDAGRSVLYRKLIREIRCPTSRNMSIGDSTHPAAADRRREIRDLVDAGMDAAEIRRFVERRYGQRALYSPRLTSGTLALWLSPALFCAAGILAWRRVVAGT